MGRIEDNLRQLDKEVEAALNPVPTKVNGRLNALLNNIKSRKLNGGKATKVK